MAHTIEDLVMNIADKYSSANNPVESQVIYKRNKEMLWDFLNKLHHPMYIENCQSQTIKNYDYRRLCKRRSCKTVKIKGI